MKYLADTANIDEIKELLNYLPIEGVTTNPTLLAHSKKKLSQIIPEILQLLGDKMIHIQVMSEKSEDMLREAKRYRDYFQLNEKYFVKIPVTKEGIRAIKMVKEAGMNVTATAVFTQQQALIAAKAGADFVAPYVNRLDNIGAQGVNVVSDIVKTFTLHSLPCNVLGASFKNVNQVYQVSLNGCHAVTLSYEIFNLLIKHPMTDKGVADFTKDGIPYYDIQF
ncbi:transaldolase family protein [Massilibacteroides vaginae]|uniref:transaldolase family protein n=1 Tax=Massilibacteroides vaginae TaxID=1673718 RepID=UPI000A1CC81C|nr:transaldolase family protein [Massilibacteroides vaginae]